MTVLEVNDLSKSYGETNVLEGLTFSVELSGQIIGILGPNGVGKTTLLEILTGQRPQDSGTASVLSYDLPEDSTEIKYDIGILPEKEAPPSFLTAREYLTFVGQDKGLNQDTIDERIDYWSKVLRFSDVLDVLASDLSRGQQQKVMITQAFLHNPDVVFIDEPLANLDPIIQSIFIDEMQSYVSEGNTVFVSTHQVEFALEVCSDLHLLSHGGSHERIGSPAGMTKGDIVNRLGEQHLDSTTGDIHE